MATKESVLEGLANALPHGIQLLFYHICTPPTPTPALFSARPGQLEEGTLCQNHFLAVSLPSKGSVEKELLVFAIEVLVFTTRKLTTIFVSKADSTGFLHSTNSSLGTSSIIKTICTTFLSYLVKQKLDGPRVLLSLFARSQNQYLFPGSIENPGKHVLDDRQLIKWWCRTLDPILRSYTSSGDAIPLASDSGTSSQAFITVPGCDKFETRSFFPPSTQAEIESRWLNSYPAELMVADVSVPVRCIIPRFPDDPKARFLDDLDSEISDTDLSSTGRWRSVKSLDQFWEMMSYRQECSAGRLVGFIWIVFTPPLRRDDFRTSPDNSNLAQSGQPDQTLEQLPTPNQSQTNNLDPLLPPSRSKNNTWEAVNATSPPPSSPPLAPIVESDQISTQTQYEHAQQDSLDPRESPLHANVPQTKSQVSDDSNSNTNAIHHPTPPLLLLEPQYNLLQTHLLSSDFSIQSLAASSTATWIAKASELAGLTTTTSTTTTTTTTTAASWGQKVTGRKKVPSQPPPLNGEQATPTPTRTVNLLTGIRKKRKVAKGGGLEGMGLSAPTTAATAPAPAALPSTPEEATPLGDLAGKKRKASAGTAES